MSECYINNQLASLIRCPKCESGYYSIQFDKPVKKKCKCGYEFVYLITSEKTIPRKVECK